MSAPKFTPGSWRAMPTRLDPANRCDRVMVYGPSGIVACAMRGSDAVDIETLNANAQLCAASPDMYAELAAIVHALEEGRIPTHGTVMAARAALAKARGEG